ncbi:hypothetical protein [Paenarthrobacter sp. YJN-5]|uniref:hypothetical protein n=1 Tax=Paenarthrobacter sp. YJN-5 TaxID=2735316 RepID=UPI0018777B3F|nr:hypothetical protein [Paenarthrobacter sp. YJN-5]QOT19639.1 hypothetical protein HMI59_23790 [Paenarthrobacter sp. YJN-5]
MEAPNAPIMARSSLRATGNYKVAIAFLYFAVTSMFLAMGTLAGAQFNGVFWVLPLVLPLAMGIKGWSTSAKLTGEAARQQADISRWDVA